MISNKELFLKIIKNLGHRDAIDLRVRSKDLDGTGLISEEEKIPEFDPLKDYSEWPSGAPVIYEDQVWILLQPHNAKNYEGNPSTLRALWGLCHTKDPDKAKLFVAPLGTSGMYMKDECVIENGNIYKCLEDNVVYSPSELPSLWNIIIR